MRAYTGRTEVKNKEEKNGNKNSVVKQVFDRLSRMRYFIVLEGIVVGAFGGGAVVLFRYGLEKVSIIVPYITEKAGAHPWVIPAWFTALAAAALVTRLLVYAEPMIGGSGIPQIKGEMHGYFDLVWWRVLPAKIAGGIITLGCGLCLGREGPSVQIGAMAGKGFSRITGRMITEERILITCGASAGLAAAFNAPLAGAIFVLEEIHKNYSFNVLLPALSASITADLVCRRVFGLAPVFDFSDAQPVAGKYFWVVILMAAAIAVIGAAYNASIAAAQDLYDIIGRKKAGGYLRTVIPFLCCGAVAFTLPQALGGGSGLVMEISAGLPLKMLVILLIVRFFYSVISFSSGVPGGIFLPLLAMGAVCGGITHALAQMAGIQLSLSGLVAIAMTASFSAIVRSPVMGTVLLAEMTGDLDMVLFMAAAALTAYITADLLGAEPIYEQLLQRILEKREQITTLDSDKNVVTEMPVELGSRICGKTVKELALPDGCLLVSIERNGSEVIPGGDTVIEPLDVLVVLCQANRVHRVQNILENLCRARL